MKKFVIATLFAAVAGVASAAGNVVGLEYKFEDPRGTGANQQGYEFTIGTQAASNVGVDLKGENMYTNGNGANSSKLEVGVTPTVGITDKLSGYVRGAVGEKWQVGNRFDYYSVEPGVKIAVNDRFGLRAGYRYRTGFSSGDNYMTRTWRIGADYGVTKNGTAFLGLDRQEGDINSNVVSVGYKYGF